MSQLAAHIAQMRLIDTHEHLYGEQEFVEKGHDVLQHLFDNYVTADLLVAGQARRLCGARSPPRSKRGRRLVPLRARPLDTMVREKSRRPEINQR